ncbi:hypothetical protein FHR83_008040 [Actinoplanes campanulatus]|uniref:Uncharacterized protein n=1 Tax=Actinoplanes campanulatus TaxID=113559 RepID=A0A7W5AQ50_9ACTN|nr:hypothetical protein [Actinoplanes campanulatus]MBB3100318.1 hypothetical protein [Actinoplanes campanulatus]GGN43903.1 hypothetical protein GCM10010109_76520 [Actinoplanes campanulatus]GID40880.1 hypothetical protein Aca09nite_73860 [Actinoplanes campanulatus]
MAPDIERLLLVDEDDLLAQIGRDIAGASARSEPRAHLIKMARDWLSINSVQFRDAICANPAVRAAMKLSPGRERQLASVVAVSDVLASVLIGIPVVTIAVLLVRNGIDGLCADRALDASE